jgi:hypothetical protein
MDYRVIRSDRRTISMSISKEGEVLIRAPRRCPASYIEAFAREKWGWVESHLPQVQSCLADRAAYALRPGMTLPVLGREVAVLPSPDGSTAFRDGRWFVPEAAFETLKPLVREQYKIIGRAYLPPRVEALAKTMGVTYGRITVNSANRRWASCSANGNLNFSWRLLMAPPEDVDYVIIHELAHRRQFDHSPAFWAIVSQFCPDWQARKSSLYALHRRLLHDNWV